MARSQRHNEKEKSGLKGPTGEVEDMASRQAATEKIRTEELPESNSIKGFAVNRTSVRGANRTARVFRGTIHGTANGNPADGLHIASDRSSIDGASLTADLFFSGSGRTYTAVIAHADCRKGIHRL